MSSYPSDRLSSMTNDGPTDQRFRVPGGILQYHPERDARFPYVYEIATHALVHASDYVKTIWVHVVDTSMDARMERARFDKSLSVPLGPNAIVDNCGMFNKLIPFPCLISLLHFCRSIGTQTGYDIICPATYGRRGIL